MEQEFSLAHLTVLGCAPPEMTYLAARAGYDYVSIRPIFMGLPGEPDYALADNPQMLKQTKRALASTGVRVHDIELARVYEGLHPTKYLPAMEVAAELGAKAVLSSIWGGEREFYIEKFGEICDLAKPFGLTVDLEYVPIAAVANLAQAVDVLRAVNRSNDRTRRDDPHHARGAALRRRGRHRCREHPRACPALRLFDRAAQQGAARGGRLCRACDAVPRDAEGLSRHAFRGEGCARQAPLQASDDREPTRRRAAMIDAHA